MQCSYMMSSINAFLLLFVLCRKHFKKIVDDPAAKAVRSRQDVMLWLWRVHNEVSQGA